MPRFQYTRGIESQDQILGLAEFEAFSEDPVQFTTSDGWVTRTNYPYTTATKTAGDYIINHSSQVGMDFKERNVGHRVRWRPGTSGTWIDLVEINNAVTRPDAFALRTGFNLINLASAGVFQVTVEFGQTDEGGEAKIQNSGITIAKVVPIT